MQHAALVILAMFFAPADAVFGDMYAWGRGDDGALGLGSLKQQNHPVQVADMVGLNARSVDAGASSTTAVTASGKVYMWGKGVTLEGKLDPTGQQKSASPVQVQGLDGIKVVGFTAGACHYSVLTDHGTVMTWGCNNHGALGRGKICPECNSLVPSVVPGLQGLNLRQLVSGGHHTAALTDNGEVYVWGSGQNGEIGNGGFIDMATPTIVKALQSVRVCQICAGEYHMAAIDTEGRVWTWGSNAIGQLGHGLNEARIAEPRAVSRFKYPDTGAIVGCGGAYTSVITASNKVFLWGEGGEPLPTEKKFFADPSVFPRAVSAGRNHVVVITKDYKVYSWGSNFQGQLGVSDSGFFTAEPQLIQELSGKYINIVAAGQNHTLALAGRPSFSTCPFFQDWYGTPGSSFNEFVSSCHKDDETCPDETCCRHGESCALFSDGKYGCCAGPEMYIAEDQKTCCPKGTIFNAVDTMCEKKVSYAEAAAVFKHYEEGELKKLDKVPMEILENTGSSMEGKPLNVIDPSNSHATTKVSEREYERHGFTAASDAIVQQYHKIAAEQAHAVADDNTATAAKLAAEEATKASAAEAAANAALAASARPSTAVPVTNESPESNASSAAPATPTSDEDEVEEEDIPYTAEELEDLQRMRELVGASSDSAGVPDVKGDVSHLKRPDIVRELLSYEQKKGLGLEIAEFNYAWMSDEDIRTKLKQIRANQAPAPASEKGLTINNEGVAQAGPFLNAIKNEEQRQALLVKAALEKDQSTTKKRKPAVRDAVDPTKTVEWIANTRLSERVAGLKRHTVHSLLTANEAPPREDDTVIPGAGNIATNKGKNAMLIQSDAGSTEAITRPGKGPCPRSAGNLDCNKDCSDVDAKVLDQLRYEDELRDSAAKSAYETIGAGYELRLKTKEEILTPTASASPSPSASWVSQTIIEKKHTLIQEGDLKVEVDSVSTHIPPPGFYRDTETNSTYKIIGDRVTLVFIGAKFVSLGNNPGSLSRGHCGAARPTCPDNSCCGEHETCCQQPDGSYGCCPFETGTCCSDRRHCCPEPYSCDLGNQACVFNGTSVGMARFDKVTQGLCDAYQRACKDGSCCDISGSCCQMYDGLQGCAPFTDAVCCSDGKHACPYGTTCDVNNNKCVDPVTSTSSRISELKYSGVPPGVGKVCYPDEITCLGGSCCVGDNTCCTSPEGYEECCPYTDGVCCSNGHCCPNGFECYADKRACIGPEGQTEMKPTVPGRAPFLIAEVCSANEYQCPGSHDPALCCVKGEGCCSATAIVNNQPELVQGCCPFGEDSVCCENGGCCPYRHTCDGSVCIAPTGEVFPKHEAKPARQSEIAGSTASCTDSRQLQDVLDAKMTDLAGEIKKNCSEPGNGTEPMFTTYGPDTGKWASEEVNELIAKEPGEAGTVKSDVPLAVVHPISDMMERRKENIIVDLLDYLRLLVTQMTRVKMNDFCTVQGKLAFSNCTFDDAADSKDTTSTRRSLAEAAEVDQEQVIVSSTSQTEIHYLIDPNPDTSVACKSILDKLKTSIISGFIMSTLNSQGFPCASYLLDSEVPVVMMDTPIDFNAKLNVIDNLHRIFGSMISQNERIAPDLIKDADALKDLIEALISLRNELGIAVRRDLSDLDLKMQEKTLITALEELITLVLSYLKTNNYDIESLELSKYKKPKLTDRIRLAHEISKCERTQPNEQPGPGCERTLMSLSSMPLRNLDDERFDPLLQRELGAALRLPPVGAQTESKQQPPQIPVVDHVPYAGNQQRDFWMPDDCHGESCRG